MYRQARQGHLTHRTFNKASPIRLDVWWPYLRALRRIEDQLIRRLLCDRVFSIQGQPLVFDLESLIGQTLYVT